MRSTNHPNEWERQRERLSAYLDGELSADERRELERHLPGCVECRAELAELRRVRALLRALPEPRLPRSFALPEEGAPADRPSRAIPRHPTPPRQPAAAARPIRPGWYRASQWTGGLAASVGLFLLLGSAILGLFGPHGAMSSNGDRAFTSASQHTPSSASGATPPNSPLTNPTATASQDKGATATSSPTTSPTPTPEPAIRSNAESEGPPLLPLTGAGLLAGGAILLVAGRLAARRKTSA